MPQLHALHLARLGEFAEDRLCCTGTQTMHTCSHMSMVQMCLCTAISSHAVQGDKVNLATLAHFLLGLLRLGCECRSWSWLFEKLRLCATSQLRDAQLEEQAMSLSSYPTLTMNTVLPSAQALLSCCDTISTAAPSDPLSRGPFAAAPAGPGSLPLGPVPVEPVLSGPRDRAPDQPSPVAGASPFATKTAQPSGNDSSIEGEEEGLGGEEGCGAANGKGQQSQGEGIAGKGRQGRGKGSSGRGRRRPRGFGKGSGRWGSRFAVPSLDESEELGEDEVEEQPPPAIIRVRIMECKGESGEGVRVVVRLGRHFVRLSCCAKHERCLRFSSQPHMPVYRPHHTVIPNPAPNCFNLPHAGCSSCAQTSRSR